MTTQSLPVDGNGGPPTLAVAGSIKTRCPHCQHEDYWTLVGEQYVCSQCGNLAIVVAATGETIEQAIQAATQELPEKVEPRQGTIPGLRPAFNYEAACKSIFEKRRELRSAESAAWLVGEKQKAAKKRVETIAAVDEDDAREALTELVLNFPDHQDGAEWIAAAIRKAHRVRCNPGGEVASIDITDSPQKAWYPRHQLLSRAELEAIAPIVKVDGGDLDD